MIVRTAAALVIVVCMLACGEKTAAVKQTTFAVDSSRGFPVITVQGRAERW